MSEKKQFANDIAISTRIRLARNVMGIPFPAI
jgi:protein-arginine kinase